MCDDKKTVEDHSSDMTSHQRDDYAQPDTDKSAFMGDELGPNTEIGSKLRALYSRIQDETIPDRFLDLLEKLDQVERLSDPKSSSDSRN